MFDPVTISAEFSGILVAPFTPMPQIKTHFIPVKATIIDTTMIGSFDRFGVATDLH